MMDLDDAIKEISKLRTWLISYHNARKHGEEVEWDVFDEVEKYLER